MGDIDKIILCIVILVAIAFLNYRKPGEETSSSILTASFPTVSYYPPWFPEKNPKDSPWLWLEPRKPFKKTVSSEKEYVEPEQKQVFVSQLTEHSEVPLDERPQMMQNMRRFRLQQIEEGGKTFIVYVYADE